MQIFLHAQKQTRKTWRLRLFVMHSRSDSLRANRGKAGQMNHIKNLHDLNNYFSFRLNTTDWLEEYRDWLSEKKIPYQERGWASLEAFNEKNIEQFINERRGK